MKKSAVLIFALAAAIAACPRAAFSQNTAGAATHREINLTTDSAPGWLPTEQQDEDATHTLTKFFTALENEHIPDAYMLLSPGNRDKQPFMQFADQSHLFNQQSGPLLARTLLMTTWTKDPPTAAPGVYAAIDYASRYAAIDRHCGYVVLYQDPTGGDFQILRVESNFIPNATAQGIVQQRSQADLDAVWAKLSANCPNYKMPEAAR